MEKVSIHDVEPSTFGDDIDRRKLADPLNTSNLAINRYVLEPGERLSGLHAHVDQEEVFIVIEGEATFETMNGEVAVGEDEVIRFAPSEFQLKTARSPLPQRATEFRPLVGTKA